MSYQLSLQKNSSQEPIPMPEIEAAPQPVEEAPQQAIEPQPEPEVQEVQQPVEEAPIAKNFRALREQKDKIERERDDYRKRVQEYENRAVPKQEAIQPDEDIMLAPDDLAEGKHLSKMQTKIKRLEDQLKNFQHQSNEISAETRLKSQFNDFDKVVTEDSIVLFKETYPEIFNTIYTSSSDIYSKGVTAYTMMKKLGIVPESTFNPDKERIQANTAKPRPLASVSPQQGDSPLSKANAFANGLTEDLKKQLLKEMMAARNN